jgi:hypothetical protein
MSARAGYVHGALDARACIEDQPSADEDEAAHVGARLEDEVAGSVTMTPFEWLR